MRLFISNLKPEVTERDLLKLFLCIRDGFPAKDAKIIRGENGQSYQYGFVWIDGDEEARIAIELLGSLKDPATGQKLLRIAESREIGDKPNQEFADLEAHIVAPVSAFFM